MTLLRERIEQKGIKQNWLAEQINVTPRTLNSWLEYKNLAQVEKFTKLLFLLEVPIIDVIEDVIEKRNKDKG